MPNPKRKHTNSRTNSRRKQNWKIRISSLSKCPQCGAMRLPHRVCPACGFYKGRIEIPKKEKAKKEETLAK